MFRHGMRTIFFTLLLILSATAEAQERWTATWATAPEQIGAENMPKERLSGRVLRQVIHVTLGGDSVRLKLTNEFSSEPVEIQAVSIAQALDGHHINPETVGHLTFNGRQQVTIGGGEAVWSDALPYALHPLQRLAVSIHYGNRTPSLATCHRGSRTTSYIGSPGKPQGTQRALTAMDFDDTTLESIDHWYNLAALEVLTTMTPRCIVALGNSITDGNGTTTNAQNRWTDRMAEYLGGKVGVVNMGIGASAMTMTSSPDCGRLRFDRDVLGQQGATDVIVYYGVNDIGSCQQDYEQTTDSLIHTYQQFIRKAHAHGLRIYLATITPFGRSFYASPFHEAMRQTVNTWIRACKECDGIIDFDAVVRDHLHPDCLQERYSKDWLHLNPSGYDVIGRYAAETITSTAKRQEEDGARLWLRYDMVATAHIHTESSDPTTRIAMDELTRYWQGAPLRLVVQEECGLEEGGFRVQTYPARRVTDVLREAQFAVHTATPSDDAPDSITLTASSPIGLLYGAYDMLRRQAIHQPLHDYSDAPRIPLRMLNHWDNLDGSIERGYAGSSLFWRATPPAASDAQTASIIQYARANASIGINATVLNNVNASPQMLSKDVLRRVKTYADLLRPYGIRVFLAVNFATPMTLSGLPTADPLDTKVQQWWSRKVKEIYTLIPDFGGFLVKANSEGQPGPRDFGRTQAEGANMLADALQPYGGIVIWRSFVYSQGDGTVDRVMQAVDEFKPLDGLFHDNVRLQSKNGPLDFQPREPFAPIFSQMHATPQMAELQITQEYTGQSIHLVYLAPMWNEFFQHVDYRTLKGIAGVANIGTDANFCGHHFSQANWYAFGRLAWNPELDGGAIAREWLCQTFTTDERFVDKVSSMMLSSREACVDYMMPLGLHHIFEYDHHYGPHPGGNRPGTPAQWNPVYYERIDSVGIGFDRTMATGSGAVGQYPAPYDALYGNRDTCPEELLLWFHHVPWNYRLHNGLTLIDNLQLHYHRGVQTVESYVDTWQQMRPYVDERRWQDVDARLYQQVQNARLWRDTCLKYYQQQIRQ